ncbi:DNA polymerase [Bacillus sp. JJ1503]|uniref:DNA polymerase n=1 Tax=Bacillus sp. JJ1503 TaxID=3122956 RepID=UPI002FFE2590
MTLNIQLNLRSKASEEVSERVKAAGKRKASASETIEEAFERVGGMKLSDKERELYAIAKTAYFSGTIGRLREGKLAKAEVLEMGRRKQTEEAEKLRQQRLRETADHVPDNYHIVTDDGKLGKMMDRLREEVRLQASDPWFKAIFARFNDTAIRKKLLERGIEIPLVQSLTVWDTETSGVDTMIDLTGGYSFWLPLLNEGYYVAYGHLTGEKQCTRSKALAVIRRFMELEAHLKSFHNAEFDLNMFRNDGMYPMGVRYDSMDAQKILLDYESTYALKSLFTKYKQAIGGEAAEMDDTTFEDLFGNSSPMIHPIKPVGVYAIKDVHKGWLLTKWQLETMLKTDDLAKAYFEIRQYLPQVNVEITRTGFEVDLEELARLGVDYREQHGKAMRELYETYELNSSDFLYEMSMTLKGDKIAEWVDAQRKRIEKQAEMLRKCQAELATANPVTKKYDQLKDRIERYRNNPLPEAIPQNAPDYVPEFNLASNDHLAFLIYDKLGIKDRTKEIVKDKKKTRAVSADVLERYFKEEESLKPLATFTKFEKLLGTYVDKIPQALDVDGRIHTSLKTVSTGRYGSSGYNGKPNEVKPAENTDENYIDIMRKLVDCDEKVPKGTNLQNIPSRNEEGLKVRKTFKPRDGYTFLGSDLSSIEPRLQAHRMATEFGDEMFAEMFRKGLDPYIEFASMMFDVQRELCAEKAYREGLINIPYRKLTKDMFLAKGYGQAEDQFVKIAVKRGITEQAAKEGYAKFDVILPGFSKMVEETFEHLRQHGWVATLWGQKRRFPDYKAQWQRLCVLMKKAKINGKNDPELAPKSRRLKWEERSEFWELIKATGRAERQAFNHTIQGSGANVLQLCMIRSYYECTLARGWEFNLTLHDEQKHSIPNDQLTPEAVALYNDIMTNTVALETPLECDTVIEVCWMEEYSADEWDFELQKPKEAV